MAQIFSLSEGLENIGDYAWFLSEDGMHILAFKYESSHWAFYGKDGCRFEGSDRPRSESVYLRFPFLREYNHSWIVPGDNTLAWGVADITDDTSIGDLTIVTQSLAIDANLSDIAIETPIVEDVVESFTSDKYTSDTEYVGFHSYHRHHGVSMNMPKNRFSGHRIGIELEVEFMTSSKRTKFCDTPSNWFYRESDGSLGSNGCEIITIPLLPKDAKSIDFWKPLTDYLCSRAQSWDTGRCGLHVHIGREILGVSDEEKSETIGKLLYLYHHFVKDTRMNIKIYGRERGYHDQDGKSLAGSSAKELGSEVLKIKSVKDKVKTAMIAKSSSDRYFDINLRNTYTIEFRKGRGSINPERITMVVDYCERMCLYAKSTPWQQISYEDFVKFLKATIKNEKLLDIVNSYS